MQRELLYTNTHTHTLICLTLVIKTRIILIYRFDFLPPGAFASHWAWAGNPQAGGSVARGSTWSLCTAREETWHGAGGAWISQQHLPSLGPPGRKSAVCAWRRRKIHWRDHCIFLCRVTVCTVKVQTPLTVGLLLVCLFILSSTVEVSAVWIAFM